MKKGERSEMDLGLGDRVEDARISMVVEYSCNVTGTLEGLEEAKRGFEVLARSFTKVCHEAGVHVSFPAGIIRPMNRQEALEFTPRKFHWAPGGERICDVPYVSRTQLTDDRSKVTCKRCLKKLEGQKDERVEAGGGKAEGREERPRAREAEAGSGQEGH